MLQDAAPGMLQDAAPGMLQDAAGRASRTPPGVHANRTRRRACKQDAAPCMQAGRRPGYAARLISKGNLASYRATARAKYPWAATVTKSKWAGQT
jgi:hypothetical protein